MNVTFPTHNEVPYAKKELEDIKVVLDIALWIILYLGANNQIPKIWTATSTICLIAGRFTCDAHVFETAEKVVKYSPHIECLIGLTLNFAVMFDQISLNWNIWGLFAAQLGITTIQHLSKRISGSERYHCKESNKKKYFEDLKCFIENIALWTIFALGDFGVLNTLQVGIGGLVAISCRTFCEYSLHKLDNGAQKTARLFAFFEFIVATTLISLMMGHVLTSDQSLWLFFAVQLFVLAVQQIARRVDGKEDERYSCFLSPVRREGNSGIMAPEAK